MSQTNTNVTLQSIINFIDTSKQSLLKIAQYACILIAYYHENRDNKAERYDYFFKYKHIFNIRRMFRIGQFVIQFGKVRNAFRKLTKSFSPQALFQLISHLLKTLFYIVDHAAVIMNVMYHHQYYIARRASFSIFLAAILSTIIYCTIKLRRFYEEQNLMKTPVGAGKLQPQAFIGRLKQLDYERLKVELEIASSLGDLIPTLQRTNLNQIIIKTRMNKGTVGWSGIIAGICELIRLHLK